MDEPAGTQLIRMKMNPSRQYLAGKQRDYQMRLDLFRGRWQDDPEKSAIVAACQSHLKDIECLLCDACSASLKKIFTIWHLFHRIDEYFYLLMNRAELKAQGWELIQGLKKSPITLQAKTDWIVKIQEVLKTIDKPESEQEKQELGEVAQMLNAAAYIHNDCVDNLFWDYWCRKYFAFIYTIFLIILLVIFMYLYYRSHFTLCAWSALLVGAIGGLVSGIMTTQIESIPYGQFWVSTWYHALVRPIQGAIAALMVFWMLQSQYMLKITPPLAPGRVVFTCLSSSRIELPVACSPPSIVSNFTNVTGVRGALGRETRTEAKTDPIVVLRAAPGMQVYLYLLVLLVAGFSGDKALRFVSDKVSGRLFNEAEKTKEAK